MSDLNETVQELLDREDDLKRMLKHAQARVLYLELQLPYEEQLEAAHKTGATAERAAVVAWLRSDMGQAYDICHAANEDERYPYRDLADAIESGAHLADKEQP